LLKQRKGVIEMQLITKPQSFSDLVFGDEESAQLLRAILNQQITLPDYGKTALLLYGVFGTGKTTAADILCEEIERAISGDELGAAAHWINCDNQKDITEVIKDAEAHRAHVSFNASRLHYYVFDEVDNLTKEGQKKLKLFLNHSDIICVLTTNYVGNVDEGVQSRCYSINCNAASASQVLPRVKRVLQQHNLPVPSDKALLEKIAACEGSWREILPAVLMLAQSEAA
jgi:replication-associated recombination protein RarA